MDLINQPTAWLVSNSWGTVLIFEHRSYPGSPMFCLGRTFSKTSSKYLHIVFIDDDVYFTHTHIQTLSFWKQAVKMYEITELKSKPGRSF